MNNQDEVIGELEEEIKQLVLAMRSLILAGTNTSERIAIHHAKKLLEQYEHVS